MGTGTKHPYRVCNVFLKRRGKSPAHFFTFNKEAALPPTPKGAGFRAVDRMTEVDITSLWPERNHIQARLLLIIESRRMAVDSLFASILSALSEAGAVTISGEGSMERDALRVLSYATAYKSLFFSTVSGITGIVTVLSNRPRSLSSLVASAAPATMAIAAMALSISSIVHATRENAASQMRLPLFVGSGAVILVEAIFRRRALGFSDSR